jgi:hypothetical protein
MVARSSLTINRQSVDNTFDNFERVKQKARTSIERVYFNISLSSTPTTD